VQNNIQEKWTYIQFCDNFRHSINFHTKVVRSNPVYGEVYSMQYYVIKFVSDLRQVGALLRVLWVPPPPRYNWNIVESGVKHHKQKHINFHTL